MKKFVLSILPVTCLLISCDHFSEKKLVGKWKAASVTEDGMPLEVDPSVIAFKFMPNGFYNFNSTVNYKEAGTFSVSGDMLYTLDTVNEASSEKAVKILQLSNDSLTLQMNAEGKTRLLRLAKVN